MPAISRDHTRKTKNRKKYSLQHYNIKSRKKTQAAVLPVSCVKHWREIESVQPNDQINIQNFGPILLSASSIGQQISLLRDICCPIDDALSSMGPKFWMFI
jgi:hypothetical protein